MASKKVRGSYAGTLTKKLDKDGNYKLSKDMLHKYGKHLVDYIKIEAKKDMARRSTPGGPVGLPNSPRFWNSFHYRIKGTSTVEIYSTWPWIEGLIEGRKAGPMRAHTQANPKLTGKVIPFYKDGVVIFRMAPSRGGKLWIHPGIARHTFIERAVRKCRKALKDGLLSQWIKEDVGK
jgi:hypothetical protein